MLLGLNSLVETIAPTATLHDTACLLINNLDLAIDNDILVILVEHGVSLEQLLESMHALALQCIVGKHLVLLVQALLVGDTGLVLKRRHLRSDVGQYKELVIIDLGGEPCSSLIGKVGTVELLVYHKVERFDGLGHTAVVVLHIHLLGTLQTRLDAILREIFDKRLVLGESLERTEKSKEALSLQLLSLLGICLFLCGADFLACLGKEFGSLLALNFIETLNEGLELLEHLVVALGDRARDDKWGTGIVNQYRVDLIDDGVVVAALHKVGRRNCHIVTQIVEAELIVGTKGNISLISLATGLRIGLVLIDTIYTKSIEHIEWAHPLGVTLGQIVIDGHHVYTVAGERIEEYWQSSHESLTLTSSHLGNLTLMEGDTTENLHIVVYHIPLHLVTSGRPLVVVNGLVAIDGDKVVGRIGSQFTVEIVGNNHSLLVLGKAAGGILDDAIGNRHNIVEGLLVLLERVLLKTVYLVENLFTLINRSFLDGGTQLGYLLFLCQGSILHILLYLLGLGTQFVVAQGLDGRVCFLYLFYKGLDEFHVAGGLVSKQRLQNFVEIHCLYYFIYYLDNHVQRYEYFRTIMHYLPYFNHTQ